MRGGAEKMQPKEKKKKRDYGSNSPLLVLSVTTHVEHNAHSFHSLCTNAEKKFMLQQMNFPHQV
jgi:hypothetical protein